MSRDRDSVPYVDMDSDSASPRTAVSPSGLAGMIVANTEPSATPSELKSNIRSYLTLHMPVDSIERAPGPGVSFAVRLRSPQDRDKAVAMLSGKEIDGLSGDNGLLAVAAPVCSVCLAVGHASESCTENTSSPSTTFNSPILGGSGSIQMGSVDKKQNGLDSLDFTGFSSYEDKPGASATPIATPTAAGVGDAAGSSDLPKKDKKDKKGKKKGKEADDDDNSDDGGGGGGGKKKKQIKELKAQLHARDELLRDIDAATDTHPLKPEHWNRLHQLVNDRLDTDQIMTEYEIAKVEDKEEAKLLTKMKEPKTLFANERTMLSWMNASLKLGAIGTALLTFFSHDPIIVGLGCVMWAIAVAFMIYAVVMFRRRGEALISATHGPFYDRYGPIAMMVFVVIAVCVFVTTIVVWAPKAKIGTHEK